MAQETQVRTIIIKTDTKGSQDIKAITSAMGDMNKQLKQTASSVTSLNNIATGFAGASIFGFGAGELIGMVDSMIMLNSRLVSLTGSVGAANTVMSQLADIATITRQRLSDTAESFTRIATATVNLNLPTQVQLDLTKGLLQSFKLAGATATEAANATIQFAQALSFGRLSGQELRSVTSQNAIVANILADSIKGTGKNIKEFAEEGGFTTSFLLKNLLPAFKNLDSSAQGMSQTFEQTANLAMNELQKKMAALNEEFDLSGKFASFLQYVLDNGDEINAIFLTMGLTAIPAVISAAGRLLALLTPIRIAFALWAAAIYLSTSLMLEAAGGFKGLKREIEALSPILSLMYKENRLYNMRGILSATEVNRLTLEIANLKTELNIIRDMPGLDITKKILPVGNITGENIFGATPFWERIGGDPDKFEPVADKIRMTVEQRIGALTSLFNKGKIEVEEYNKRLLVLQKIQFDEKISKGAMTIEKMNREMRENELEAWGRLLEYNKITLEEFNVKAREFNMDELEYKFKRGKITLAQFNLEMLKMRDQGYFSMDNLTTGTALYIESVENKSVQIAGFVQNTFDTLGDSIFNMTRKGKYDFSEFTQSVIDDLTRIVIRMSIIEPLAKSLLGAAGSFFSSPSSTPVAPIAMQRPEPYAMGGIVDSPTFFGMRGGKMGVMGEAGTEAIMPLRRGSDGTLGVSATAPKTVVVVNNYTNSSVETRESQGPDGVKQLEILVKNTVLNQMGNGTYDRAMQTNFGVSRKGG